MLLNGVVASFADFYVMSSTVYRNDSTVFLLKSRNKRNYLDRILVLALPSSAINPAWSECIEFVQTVSLFANHVQTPFPQISEDKQFPMNLNEN